MHPPTATGATADSSGGVPGVCDLPAALAGVPARCRDRRALTRGATLSAVASHRPDLAGVSTSARGSALAITADPGDGALPVAAVADRSALRVVHRVTTVALVPVRRVPALTGVVHGLSTRATLAAIPAIPAGTAGTALASISAVRGLTAVVRVMVVMSLPMFHPMMVVMVVVPGVTVAAEVVDERAEQGHQFAVIETGQTAAAVGRSALRDQITAGLRPTGEPALALLGLRAGRGHRIESGSQDGDHQDARK